MEQQAAKGHYAAKLRGKEYQSQNRKFDYLPVRMEDGRFLQGGNQEWWCGKIVDAGVLEARKSNYQKCRESEEYRIANLGCGVIAMTDLQLYLSKREAENDASIQKEDYERHTIYNWKSAYGIGKSYVNYLSGLYPWKMEEGLRVFLKDWKCDRQKVRWAPYAFRTNAEQRRLAWTAIVDMLRADYPVVISYHTFSPKQNALIMYKQKEDALEGAAVKPGDQRVTSHYMTVIGAWDSGDGKRLLQVESWGEIYFIRFEQYAKRLNYFTNYLWIY